MIAWIIASSVRNRLLVLLLTAMLVAAGVWATLHVSLDAIPDVSDVQVIVITDYPGHYSPEHRQGLWHDEAQNKWYSDPAQAPAEQRAALVKVRAFDKPGTCPLTGRPLLSSNQDLASLRSLQDWYLRYQLTAVRN